jgi:predicted transcriptional regulator
MKLMPQEIEVRYIIPSLRKELATSLKEKGLKQREIAETLNITPAAVSQYIKEKRGTTEFNKEILKEIEKSGTKIIKDRFATQKELLKLTMTIRKSKTICDIHKQHDCVPENCDFCFRK